jgi:hypothetical protein
MAFSQSLIADVRVLRDDAELYVAWTSPAPPGTVFQVYVDRRLAWSGRCRFCNVPLPFNAVGRNVWIEVGTVDPGDATTDYSASLSGPGGTGNRAQLTWLGGTYLDPTGHDDIQGFFIYQSAAPGAAIDFSTVVGIVPAYPGGAITDGFGMGGFGLGGFGRAATLYQWQSGPLASGTWQFVVEPYDHAGNSQASPQPVSVVISTAPRPPALDANGDRLTYTYSGSAARLATLGWQASPSS